MNIALAILLSRRHFSTRLVEFPHVQLLKLCFRQQEKSMPSKRESIFLVACVEECWVRLACSHCVNRLVPGRHVQDPVRVNVESDFNLRQATWRWRDPIEIELPKRIVVLSHHTLPFEDLDENTRLIVSVRRERLSLLHEKRVAFHAHGGASQTSLHHSQ